MSNPVDAIGSVANFLSKKGKWKPNTPIAIKAKVMGSDISHIVNSGENLTSIAKKYKTTVSKIVKRNNLNHLTEENHGVKFYLFLIK